MSADEIVELLLSDEGASLGLMTPVDDDLLEALRRRRPDVALFDPSAPTGRVDRLLIAGALERATAPARLLADAAELVGPDGSLVVAVPNATHVDVVLLLWSGRTTLPPWLRDVDLAVCSPAGITEVLAEAGLGVRSVQRQTAEVFRSGVVVDPAGIPTAVRQAALDRPEATTARWVLTLARGAPALEVGEVRPAVADRVDRLIEENDYLRGRVTELAELVEQLRAAEAARGRRWWQRRP